MGTYKINMRHNCGFFSDFLTIIAGIMYCHDNGFEFYIDWKNQYYNKNNYGNLFDKYFYQKTTEDMDFDNVFQTLTPYKYYFSANDNYNTLLKPSKILHDYNILNNEFFKSNRKKKK